MAKGDNNKDDKTKTLAIPILVDISKTFLLSKCCVKALIYSACRTRNRADSYKDCCVLSNKAGVNL